MNITHESPRLLFRHTVATLAYRASKVLRDAPASFADFSVGPSSRTPVQILAHMGDLFDWALTIARGSEEWHTATPLPWNQEVERFFAALTAFDQELASNNPLDDAVIELMFQGPLADAFTHTGQLSLLRRLVGQPVRGESYPSADIVVGRTGIHQTAARREFD
ncbi:MAG: hypothetical protein ABJC26_16570 [Gemmatimonadaceae bacterium]